MLNHVVLRCHSWSPCWGFRPFQKICLFWADLVLVPPPVNFTSFIRFSWMFERHQHTLSRGRACVRLLWEGCVFSPHPEGCLLACQSPPHQATLMYVPRSLFFFSICSAPSRAAELCFLPSSHSTAGSSLWRYLRHFPARSLPSSSSSTATYKHFYIIVSSVFPAVPSKECPSIQSRWK